MMVNQEIRVLLDRQRDGHLIDDDMINVIVSEVSVSDANVYDRIFANLDAPKNPHAYFLLGIAVGAAILLN